MLKKKSSNLNLLQPTLMSVFLFCTTNCPKTINISIMTKKKEQNVTFEMLKLMKIRIFAWNKWLKRLIDYQKSCQLIDYLTSWCSSIMSFYFCRKWTNTNSMLENVSQILVSVPHNKRKSAFVFRSTIIHTC